MSESKPANAPDAEDAAAADATAAEASGADAETEALANDLVMAGLHLEAEVLHCHDVPESLRDALDRDGGHGGSLSSLRPGRAG